MAASEHKTRVLFLNPKQEVTERLYTERVAKQYAESAYVLPNMAIAYLAAHLERLGFEVGILDAYALRLSVAEAAARVREFKPLAVCFNIYTQNFHSALSWITAIKSLTSVTTIVGGPQMSLYPREVMTHPAIDFAATGEGWRTLPELLECLSGGGDPSRVPGVCFRREGEFFAAAPRPDDLSLEDVPFPARHLLPNDRYTTVMTQAWPITVMLSALGCPFHCAYCDVPGKRYQARSADHVAAEMEECERRFGIQEILFQDETFTFNRERVLKICEGIGRRGLKVQWSIRSRPDRVDREMLRAMRQAGLTKINFGIESGDEAMLRAFHRDVPLETIRQAVRWTKEEGITTLGFFMVGLPGEDREGLKKTRRFALELGCDFVQVNKFVPQPPSELYRQVVRETGIDYWREYTLGNTGILEKLPAFGAGLDSKFLDEWQRRFFRSYYYRPSYVLGRLKKIKSFRKFAGLARAALSIR
jgi:radical SAM superfamily enzyme YgiQ (UPF0313 family)